MNVFSLLASWSAKCARYTYSSDISLFKCIDHASMMVVRAVVGEDVLILLVYSRCGRPSAHPLPFTFPSLLSFRYMRYFRALILSSSVSWCQCFGVNPSISWIWCDSVSIASLLFSSSTFKPFFQPICLVRKRYSESFVTSFGSPLNSSSLVSSFRPSFHPRSSVS